MTEFNPDVKIIDSLSYKYPSFTDLLSKEDQEKYFPDGRMFHYQDPLTLALVRAMEKLVY